MSGANSREEYFPLKPADENGFKPPVSWLGGRELVSSLKAMIIYSIYGENIDPRAWMKSNVYPAVDEKDNDAVAAVNLAWAKKTAGYWDWKRTRFNFWDAYLTHKSGQAEDEPAEFWFDYIADSGDGQMGVYSVACLCLSDLWLERDETDRITVGFEPPETAYFDKKILLPRGSFLFVGGDTAYHVADYSSLHERFQNPFRWAFADVRKNMVEKYGLKASAEQFFILDEETRSITGKEWNGMLSKIKETDPEEFLDTEPVRPLFGVPGNHDYYDDIDGFNRQFRRPPFEDLQENRFDTRYTDGLPLAIPTFQREQEASYTAVRLPFDWWFLGIDSENEKLDFRQRVFFKQLEKSKMKKVILATPEPTTVFGRKCGDNDKTATYLKDITKFIGLRQPFLNNGELSLLSPEEAAADKIIVEPGDYGRLDLSGDVHHYARYWGPNSDSDDPRAQFQSENYASLVSGGGGAFFDPTETLFGKSEVITNNRKASLRGEIPPQVTFPTPENSRRATAGRIFDLRNIRKGGYVQIGGAAIAVIIFYSLNNVSEIRDFFQAIKNSSISEILSGVYPALYLLLSMILLVVSGFSMHKLIGQLKDTRAKKITKEDEIKKGKISELRIPFFTFAVGASVYYLLFFGLQGLADDQFSFSNIQGYAKTLLLLLNLIIAGLIAWLSVEYSNWITIRFKFLSESKERPDSWINLFFSARSVQSTEDYLEKNSSLIRRIGTWYRTKTVETIPIFLLNGVALGVLILGMYRFGDRNLSQVAIELLFTIVMLGGFLGLINFAASTGAARHKSRGKLPFFAIGFWHALLQLFTPFILVYYSDWRFVIAVFILSVLTNGFPLHLGARVMKRGSTALLSAAWVVYGLVVLVTPFFLPKERGIAEVVAASVKYLTGFSADWLTFAIAIALVCFLGYRMSRVWFSWYLAVSLAFNGHNNEVGGAARIEGFKHILRIKVEKEKLTVFVIGFDRPATDMNKLSLKLVDKFELKCKSLP